MSLLFRLAIGLLFAVFGLFSYFTSAEENPVTGEVQRIRLSPQQEVALGAQARDELIAQHGGLFPSEPLQAYLDGVGNRVVEQSEAASMPYPFEFHLLRDSETINAFALPGGQVFITAALLSQLDTEAQLAGVLGHEVGHVVARHGAEHLARQQLGAFLVNAIAISASDDPNSGRSAAVIAQAVNQLVNLNYSRDDELESDALGFDFMIDAGYDPQGLVALMQILQSARPDGAPPEFLSSHPDPGNRVGRIRELISETFPDGVPTELETGEARFDQVIETR